MPPPILGDNRGAWQKFRPILRGKNTVSETNIYSKYWMAPFGENRIIRSISEKFSIPT
jgi:hemolysin-activating ACP:hemolysin acyltransferase